MNAGPAKAATTRRLRNAASRPRRSCVLALAGAALVAADVTTPAAQAPAPARKHVLAWADVRNGYQHDSISHAVATIERLGRESGAYDTFIRTDSQLITKHPITFAAGTGIATGEQFNVRNLNYFDAIFFFGVREIDLSAEQRADLLSFVRDDGKGFVAAHSAATAFFSWPEFGEMLGGRFDEHPWGIADGTVVVDDPTFPAMRHLPRVQGVPRRALSDQGFLARQDPRARASRRVEAGSHAGRSCIARTATSRRPGRRPTARARVFYSILGHADENWDDPLIAKMYFEAIRWALGLVDGNASPSSR